MNRPGYTQPPITILRPLPAIAQAGSVFATDERGSGTYVYALVPNPATTGFADMALFYRWAIGRDGTPVADSWQQLATPPWTAAETIDSGTDMIVDATDGRPYLINADNVPVGPPIRYHRLRRYDPTTNAWTALTAAAPNDLETILGLAAPITNASLAHICSAVNPVVAAPIENLIFLAVGNGAAAAQYDKSGPNTWALAPAGVARAGAPGAGSSLSFIASDPNALYALRGGGTAVLDRYTYAGAGAWAAANLIPGTETFGVGAEVAAVRGYPDALFVHRNGHILRVAPIGATVEPLCSMEGPDGTQHEGKGIVAYSVGTKIFVAVRKHSGVEFQRIELVL